jgi:hypothetical protein
LPDPDRRHRRQWLVVENGSRVSHGQQLHLLGPLLRSKKTGAGGHRPVVAMIVSRQNVGQTFSHQLARSLSSRLPAEQRGSIDLDPGPQRLPVTDPFHRAAAVPLGVSQDRQEPELQHLGQRRGRDVECYQTGKLDQNVAGTIEREIPRHHHGPGERPVEHDLGAAMQTRGSWSSLAQRVEGLVVCRRGAGLGAAGFDVRGETDIGNTLPRHVVEDLHRLFHGARTVIDPRQQVGVEVDHASGIRSRSTEMANSSRRCGASSA